MDKPRKPVITPASRTLRAKVGTGTVSRESVENAEDVIKRTRDDTDIQPFAQAHIEDIHRFLQALRDDGETGIIVDDIARSVMDFKSSVAMFSEGAYVRLPVIMLRWIESVERVDKDVFDVLNGYYVTLDQIFNGKLADESHIRLIIEEMEQACARYFAKHPELELAAEMDNAKEF